jgi:hypothetical protein
MTRRPVGSADFKGGKVTKKATPVVPAQDPVIGQTIVAVRAMTKKETEAEGWEEDFHGPATVIVLANGTRIYASQDEEGNGPGALFGAEKNGPTFYLLPPQ